MDLWAIPGVTDSGSIVPTNYVSAPTIDTPSYLIAPSPGYGVMDIPTFTAVPDQSGGWAGGVGAFFSGSGASIASGLKNATNSISSFFTTPSNSNAATVQATAGAGGAILNTVSSFFKSGTSPAKGVATQPTGSGVTSALANAWQSFTGGIGSGLGNITGGATKPLLPVLFLVVAGLVVGFLVLGRLQRST